MFKFYKEYDVNSKILFVLISILFFIILYYHHFGDFVFYHSDYNTIIGNISYYLANSKWNTDSFVTYAYQIFPQKITAYTLVIFDSLFGKFENFNSREWIGFIFRIYLFLAAIMTVHFTVQIYKFFYKEKSWILVLLFFTSYIFYFCFTEIRNDGFYVFFVTLITYRCIIFYNKVSLKNLFYISIFFALSLLTRIPTISLGFPFLVLASILFFEKRLTIKQLLNYMLSFIFITTLVYLIINGRNLDFYLNYYKNSPLFNDYGEINFFQSYSGTKQLSFFWYLDYWFNSGMGVIKSTLCLVGVYLFFSDSKNKEFRLKLFILSVPLSIIFMLSFHKVVADRYSFALIPFIIFFSTIVLSKLYSNEKFLKKIFFFCICFLLILKIILWMFTFFQDSTRIKSIEWINKNIPKGSGIIFYNMYDWNSKAYQKLNEDYSLWQYFSPSLKINDVEKLSRLGYEYFLHGETGFQYYYPELKPYLIKNKNSYHMKNEFENFYSTFIRKTELKTSFYNQIFESGLFHSKGYDTSNYLKDIYQPILQISKIKDEHMSNEYFNFEADALSKKFYDIYDYNNISHIRLKKSEDHFYYTGPYESLPLGKYNLEINFLNLLNNEIEIILLIKILNKELISKQKILLNDKNSKYSIDFEVNKLGKNQIEFTIKSLSDKIFIKNLKIKKI